MKRNNIIHEWLEKYSDPEVEKNVKEKLEDIINGSKENRLG